MIPLLSINLFLTGVIALGIALKLFLSYRRDGLVAVYYFGMFYAFLGTFFVLNGVPLITNNLMLVTWGSMLGYAAFLLSLGYGGFVALSMAHRAESARVLFDIFWVSALFMLVVRITDFNLSEVKIAGQYVYWQPVFSPILRAAVGLGGIGVFLVSAIVFFGEGMHHKDDSVIYHRSLFLGFGMLSLLLAAFFGLLLAAFIDYFASVLIATIFIVIGLLLALRGILYRIGGAL